MLEAYVGVTPFQEKGDVHMMPKIARQPAAVVLALSLATIGGRILVHASSFTMNADDYLMSGQGVYLDPDDFENSCAFGVGGSVEWSCPHYPFPYTWSSTNPYMPHGTQTSPMNDPDGLLYMQADGNLVLYDSEWTPYWSSGTDGNPGARFVAQSDWNLVIYTSGDETIWSLF